jgi:hypothetical protein
MKLPEKIASVVKRVFISGAAAVLLSPPVMRIKDTENADWYFWTLLCTSLVLIAPVFAGFIRRSWRAIYLKSLPPVYIGLLIGSSILAHKHFAPLLYRNGKIAPEIAVDLAMTAIGLLLGLVAQAMIFMAAFTSDTGNEEHFSQSSENEKLVVAEDAEYSSTLPRPSTKDV